MVFVYLLKIRNLFDLVAAYYRCHRKAGNSVGTSHIFQHFGSVPLDISDLACNPPIADLADECGEISLSQEERLRDAPFVGMTFNTTPCHKSVLSPITPHATIASTSATMSEDPHGGTPFRTSQGLTHWRKRAIAKTLVSRAELHRWLSRTGQKRVKVGKKRSKSVHISSIESPVEKQQEHENLGLCDGGEPVRLDKGEAMQPDKEKAMQLDKEEMQLANLQTIPCTNMEEEPNVVAADPQPKKLHDSIAKGTPRGDKDENTRCLMEFLCKADVPPEPINLIECMEIVNEVKLLSGQSSVTIGNMDILDVLKLKGIQLTTPRQQRLGRSHGMFM
ncbi:hypothetical protein Cni_G21070 [Canna indica]|uniref:Uncharacterized protein n=1 Tax=Canna indica TaxID=4628 RepID=A0AAQ3KQ21_9LILI|nr:hypothetical protein Cni_G21070 [Canna indica]